jgi:hypothetical protein
MKPVHEVSCAWVAARLEPWIAGDLEAAAHGAVREHLAACAACRAALRQAEPLMIFTELNDRPRPAAAWDGFWEGIQEALPARPAAPPRFAPRRQAAMWLAAAAAIVLLVAGWVLTSGLRTPDADGGHPAPLNVAGAGSHAPVTVPPVQALLAAGVPLPQTVEQVNTPGARPVQVFSMAYRPGSAAEPSGPAGDAPAAGEVTELVLIVDAGLEL